MNDPVLDAAGRVCLGVALAGLGVMPFFSGTLPVSLVPVAGTPLPDFVAAAYGAVLVAGTLLAVTRSAGTLGPFVICALGALAISAVHAPMLIAKHGALLLWLPPGEIAVLSAGALLCVGQRNVARALIAPSLVYFGALHVVYMAFVANLIPAWLPLRTALTIATGAVFLLAGVATAIDRAITPAGIALGVMMAIFVLVLHGPRIATQPRTEGEWASGFIALGFAGVGFLLATAREAPHSREPVK